MFIKLTQYYENGNHQVQLINKSSITKVRDFNGRGHVYITLAYSFFTLETFEEIENLLSKGGEK